MTPLNTKADFWRHVKKTRTCWLWTGCSEKGYGRFSWQRKQRRVHRLVWSWVFGRIPRGKHVLHKCDVSLCVRPSHLFLGNQRLNMEDKVAKHRHRKKLTPANVIDIKRRRHESQAALAKEFNVSQPAISWAIHRGIA